MTPRVLITRDKLRARELIDRLAVHDISAVAVAMTEIVSIITSDAVPDLAKFHWIAFTSVNAVDVFAESLSPGQMKVIAYKKIAVVGSATARAVELRFAVEATLTSAADGASLAEEILESIDNPEANRMLWLCAENTAGEFRESLEMTGLKIDRLPIYRTDARNVGALKYDLRTARPWDLVFFAAPSQVKVFVDLMPEEKETPCVAIGSTTAAELHRLDFTNVVVCRSPELSEIEQSIVNLLS